MTRGEVVTRDGQEVVLGGISTQSVLSPARQPLFH